MMEQSLNVYLKPLDAKTVILETDLFSPTLTDMILILLFLQKTQVFYDVAQVMDEVRIKTAYCKMALCFGMNTVMH